VARAAQLAAQRTELPLLAQRLLDEKNQELESLRGQLAGTQAGQHHLHSTPHSLAWADTIEDSRGGSVEQLRDASRALSRAPELGLGDTRHHSLALAGCSAAKLVTIQEDSRGGEVRRRLAVDSTLDHMEVSRGELTEPAAPRPNLTAEEEADTPRTEAALAEKVAEIEIMTQMLNDKEELVERLQEHGAEAAQLLEDVRAELATAEGRVGEGEAERAALEGKLTEREDEVVETANLLAEARARLAEAEGRSSAEAEQALVQEVLQLREERADLARGMENLHKIIESNQRATEEQRAEAEDLWARLGGLEAEVTDGRREAAELTAGLEAKQEAILELEGALEATGRSLRTKEDEVSSLLQTQLLAQGSSHTTELMQEKHELERQVESFKHQVQTKEAEARAERERGEALARANGKLEARCLELDARCLELEAAGGQVEESLLSQVALLPLPILLPPAYLRPPPPPPTSAGCLPAGHHHHLLRLGPPAEEREAGGPRPSPRRRPGISSGSSGPGTGRKKRRLSRV
jgi:hypothetical protein